MESQIYFHSIINRNGNKIFIFIPHYCVPKHLCRSFFSNQVLLVFFLFFIFIAFINSIRRIFFYHPEELVAPWTSGGTDFHEASCMRCVALDMTTSPWWWLKFQRVTVGVVERVVTCGRRKKHGRYFILSRLATWQAGRRVFFFWVRGYLWKKSTIRMWGHWESLREKIIGGKTIWARKGGNRINWAWKGELVRERKKHTKE